MSKTFAVQSPAPNPVQIEPAHVQVGMSVGQGLLLHSCRVGAMGRPDANVTQICPTAQSLLATQVGALATTLLHRWLSQRARMAWPAIETMFPSSAVVG
jgi:hypothetical protein